MGNTFGALFRITTLCESHDGGLDDAPNPKWVGNILFEIDLCGPSKVPTR
jgi:hypothetical protein